MKYLLLLLLCSSSFAYVPGKPTNKCSKCLILFVKCMLNTRFDSKGYLQNYPVDQLRTLQNVCNSNVDQCFSVNSCVKKP